MGGPSRAQVRAQVKEDYVASMALEAVEAAAQLHKDVMRLRVREMQGRKQAAAEGTPFGGEALVRGLRLSARTLSCTHSLTGLLTHTLHLCRSPVWTTRWTRTTRTTNRSRHGPPQPPRRWLRLET